MRILGVIPARYKSTRFPGKPLAVIWGKPMVQHVYERARSAGCLDELLVATEDERVAEAVRRFGGTAVRTSAKHASGTDRVAEVAADRDAEIVVNIQGDEPMLDPVMLVELVEPFRSGSRAEIVTMKKQVHKETDFLDPNVVKVLTDPAGFALYFSRSLIPYPRVRTKNFRVYEHLGFYAYRKESLLRFASLAPSALEEIEGLEQLRAIENGMLIQVVETSSQAQGLSVDTPADLERVRQLLEVQNEA